MLLFVTDDNKHNVCVVTCSPYPDYLQLASNTRLLSTHRGIAKMPCCMALHSNIGQEKTEAAHSVQVK